MDVVCIKDKWKFHGEYVSEDFARAPKKYEICKVIDKVKVRRSFYYRIEGYSSVFNVKGFIPLDEYLDQFTGALKSEIDEINTLKETNQRKEIYKRILER